jgi:hypothetical protein
MNTAKDLGVPENAQKYLNSCATCGFFRAHFLGVGVFHETLHLSKTLNNFGFVPLRYNFSSRVWPFENQTVVLNPFSKSVSVWIKALFVVVKCVAGNTTFRMLIIHLDV